MIAATLLVSTYLPEAFDPEAIRTFVLSFGLWAPVIYIGITVAQVVIAPIPGQVLGVAGTVYSLIAVAIGSGLTALLTRRYGRPYVERVVTPETLARFDGVRDGDATAGLFLAYLVPGLPDDALLRGRADATLSAAARRHRGRRPGTRVCAGRIRRRRTR